MMSDKNPNKNRSGPNPVKEEQIDGGRPRVDKGERSAFKVGQKVYVQNVGRVLQGPYLVETVPRAKVYTLCDGDMNSVNGGAEFGENDLVPA
ncbi:hypothetical protein F5B19DRAFT_33268 [Rostrohypoxylon terebratum]|nr:hypothetical protein F5B19DRAFT_33268 [Rostrohypoxylon terebratum]